MSFFDTVERIFSDWHYDHPRVLYSLIRSLKPQTVVEIGSYRGYAACYMAQALKENGKGKLYCIDDLSLDDHKSRYGDPVLHWRRNLRECDVLDWAELIVGKSTEVEWPKQVDFAYIDGWHSYDVAKADFRKAADLGAKCICMDDVINCVGPRLVMEDVKNLHSWEWTALELPSDNGLSICMRREPVRAATFSQELPNHPGTDISVLSAEDRRKHFKDAYEVTGVCYDVRGIALPS